MSVKCQTPSISVETKKTNNSVETKKTDNNREHAVVGVRGWLSQPENERHEAAHSCVLAQ